MHSMLAVPSKPCRLRLAATALLAVLTFSPIASAQTPLAKSWVFLQCADTKDGSPTSIAFHAGKGVALDSGGAVRKASIDEVSIHWRYEIKVDGKTASVSWHVSRLTGHAIEIRTGGTVTTYRCTQAAQKF